MNGIVGVVHPDVFQMDDLTPVMLATMQHRQGDGEPEVYTYRNISIGVCNGKLAHDEQKNVYLAVDGKICNQHELHQELHKLGYKAKKGDLNQTLLLAYEHWGPAVFEHLAGAYVIAILDKKEKRLLLARCRLGRHPMYWCQTPRYFLFASELKSLMATGAVPQTPAMDALSSYLYFGYITQDMSAIEGVSKLLPAHYLQYNFDGSKAIVPYWSYSSYFEKQAPRPLARVVKDLNGIITSAVEERLPQEGPIGCFLSGGLGSASIASYLRNQLPEEPLSAYTVGFHGRNDDDMQVANTVSAQLGMTHGAYSITPETFLDDLVKIIWHLDEPLADPMVTATWKIAELASKKVKTIFSGMGSDELFAGHSRYTQEQVSSNALRNAVHAPFNLIRKGLIPIFNLLYKPLAYQLARQTRGYSTLFDYLEQNALFNENEMRAASAKLGSIFDPEIFLSKFYNLSRIPSNVSSYLYFDVKTRLTDRYIAQYEKLTAAHSLNWQTPFLDHRLFEYLAGLPELNSLHEEDTAAYLKALVKNHLPASVVGRPKRSRKNLLKSWIEGSDMRELFMMLAQGTLVETGLISKVWLLEKINGLGRRPTAFRYLWAILQLEIWYRLFIIRPVTTRPPELTVRGLLSERL